jgi:hypothetical protein
MKRYILGDIHGEYFRCLKILKHVGLVDDDVHWQKGLKDTLIQIGDVIDRGKEPIESFALFKNLQQEALNEGGRLIRLLGNHELSCIGGPSIPGSTHGFLFEEAIKEDILTKKIIAAYVLDDWIVVHAGVMPHIYNEAADTKNLSELADDLNTRLINAVKSNDFTDEIFFTGISRGGYKEPGIFWADYDVDLLPDEDKLIKQIVGHSPPLRRKPEIKKSPGGKIINVDIGMCTRYGGNKGILVYEDKEFNSIIL